MANKRFACTLPYLDSRLLTHLYIDSNSESLSQYEAFYKCIKYKKERISERSYDMDQMEI